MPERSDPAVAEIIAIAQSFHLDSHKTSALASRVPTFSAEIQKCFEDHATWNASRGRFEGTPEWDLLVRSLMAIDASSTNKMSTHLQGSQASTETLESWLASVSSFLSSRSGSAKLVEVGNHITRPSAVPRNSSLSKLLSSDTRFNISPDKKTISLAHPVETQHKPSPWLLIADLDAALAAARQLSGFPEIVVDMEGDLQATGAASLIQVEGGGGSFIFDVLRCKDIVTQALKPILESNATTKVMHDCRNDCEALAGQFGVVLANVFDTQCAAAALEASKRMPGLNDVLCKYAGASNTRKGEVKHRPGLWDARPLAPSLLDYAAQDVVHLRQAYYTMRELLEREGKLPAALEATKGYIKLGLGHARRKLHKLSSALRSLPQASAAAAAAVGTPSSNPSGVNRERASRTPPPGCEPAAAAARPAPNQTSQPRAAASDPPPAGAGTRSRRQAADPAATEETALLFFQHLQAREDVRAAPSMHRTAFDERYHQWKQDNARLRPRGGPGGVLFALVRAKKARVVPRRDVVCLLFRDGPAQWHDLKTLAANVAHERERIESDKQGIAVSALALDCKADGRPRTVAPGLREEHLVSLRNTGTAARTWTAASVLSNRNGCFALRCPVQLPCVLGPGQSLHATLVCQPPSVGVYRSILSLQFDGFSIGRFLTLRCGDGDMEELLRAAAPFRRPERVGRKPDELQIVNGEQPEGVSSGLDIPLPRWPRDAPPAFLRALANGQVEQRLAASLRRLSPANYRAVFEDLLRLEALQMDEDIRAFDMRDALLRPSPNRACLDLTVPGLAEKRPSVLRGDSVVARVGHGSFRGFAHHIGCDTVSLRFHKSFHARLHVTLGSAAHAAAAVKADIIFEVSKAPLRGILQGLIHSHKLSPQVLFPQRGLNKAPRLVGPIVPFNRGLNGEQLQAVAAILQGRTRPAPYLLFGPPGTGKTVTLIELIRQVHHLRPASRVLVCAPSNTAADIFIQRLADLPPAEMLRFNAWTRKPSDVTSQVRGFTTLADQDPRSADADGFPAPTLRQVLDKRIIVATCNTAAKLRNMGVPRGHFDLVIVDEAGHAWEPEVTAAFACMLQSAADGGKAVDQQLVLAGDPKQLGPIVRSNLAQAHGLARSILERIMDREPYQRCPATGAYDPAFITKLVCNYRSHPAILELPNRSFYDGELRACADPVLTHALADWEHLPRKGFPVVFHGVEGQEEREANSPSWFNLSEVQVVLRYVEVLVRQSGRHSVKPHNIAVITPYSKQSDKLSKALKLADLGGADGVGVGSVERFQGQERRVIVISTVRSSPKYLDFDAEHNLGFLSNPKRFNVAVTRAQALLIVVGNPRVLARDPNWGELLWHCVDQGAYTGTALPPRGPPQRAEAGGPVDGDEEERAVQALFQRETGEPGDSGGEEEEEGDEEEEEEQQQPGARELVEGPMWRRED